MQKILNWFLLGASLALISGCGTTMMHRKYNAAISKNTPQAYTQFARKYPDSALSTDFARRANDPDYAFVATCQIGTKKAFEGFINNYPSSVYVPISKLRIEYLEKIDIQKHIYDYYRKPNKKFYKLNEQYISEHPENPFAVESKVRFPILWLKSMGGKIGVVIKLGDVVKGILVKHHRNVEDLRQKIFHKVKDMLDSEGLESVLMETPESSNELKDISTIIVVHYSEKPPVAIDIGKAQLAPGMIIAGTGIYNSLAGATLFIGIPGLLIGAVAAAILPGATKRMLGISNRYIWMEIKGSKDNATYYSGLHGLNSIYCMYREVTIQQLKAIGWHYDPIQYMIITLNGYTSVASVGSSKYVVSVALSLYSMYSDLLKSLFEKGEEVNAKNINGERALIMASAFDDSKKVKDLLVRGADVNTKAVNGVTPLMWASFNGNMEIVNDLLDRGADVNAKAESGETALMTTSVFGYSKIVNALINRGADVNAKDKYGTTALMTASWNGYTRVAMLLLAEGADVNAKDNYGRTALMYASWRGYPEIVRLLIAKGADVNAKDNYGRRALITGNYPEVAKILKAAGAKK